MIKELWINLPVKNLKRSVDFFEAIGFSFAKNSPGFTPTSAPMQIGSKPVIIMLFESSIFQSFTQNPIANAEQGTEVLFSFDAESREEVDEIAKKAEAAGANVFAKPHEKDGWMYGCGFADLDGHRWNSLFMDMSKLKG
ncbi:MAG: VOC family protein [Sphingobacteriales bacterium]